MGFGDFDGDSSQPSHWRRSATPAEEQSSSAMFTRTVAPQNQAGTRQASSPTNNADVQGIRNIAGSRDTRAGDMRGASPGLKYDSQLPSNHDHDAHKDTADPGVGLVGVEGAFNHENVESNVRDTPRPSPRGPNDVAASGHNSTRHAEDMRFHSSPVITG